MKCGILARMVGSTAIDCARSRFWSDSRHSTCVNSRPHGLSHLRFFVLQRGRKSKRNGRSSVFVKPISPIVSWRRVPIKHEMCSQFLTRIYRNGAHMSACGAASSGSEWSIPMFRADFLTFTLKTVEHSHYLPTTCNRQAKGSYSDRKRTAC